MIKAIIFDFDLTLVNTRTAYDNVIEDLKTKHGLKHPDLPMKEVMGMHAESYCNLFVDTNKGKITLEEFNSFDKTLMAKHYPKGELENKEFLIWLEEKGIKKGIISGNRLSVIEATLVNDYNKDVRFDMIFASDHYIDGKRKPELILEALNEWRLSNDEVAYVGDHPKDITAAKKAGVLAIGITTGFHDKKELEEYFPDMIIDDLSELKEIVG